MKANRKRNRTVTIALSIVAVGLLAFGSVGGARAAIVTYSDAYVAEFETQEIGVELTENGKIVNGKLMQDKAKLTPGKTYKEALGATNDGTIDEYVRITVHKYWTEGTNKDQILKDQEKLPLIELVEGADDWIVVDDVKDDETVDFYYTKPLAPGESTSDAIKGFIVDSSIVTLVDQETSADGRTIYTTYQFDGLSVALDAEVDSVQTHNVEDAMLSAWGVTPTFSGDTLTAVN